MADYLFNLFETEIGKCGIAWGGHGVAGIQLPEGREAETRARLLRRFPEAREAAPSPPIQAALDAIVALLQGEAADLSGVDLDMGGLPDFQRRVYQTARSIPPGTTVSYGELASRLGSPGSARAVGQALGRNPFAILVPCHRVLAADGRVGGFSANGGIATKLRLLSIEDGAANGAALFDRDGIYGFDPIAAIAHLRRSDPELVALFDAVGPFRMRVERAPSIFLALAEAIVYQQLTGKAAATIFARVRALFPRAHQGLTPEQLLRVSEARLRGAGLSRAKTLALRDLARKAVDGRLPTLAEVNSMEDEAIIERLTEVRGIGRWTAEMLLIFHLGRPDVWPVDDYGIRKGFALAFRKRKLPTPRALLKYGDRWRPYRTVVSWYLWRAVELPRDSPQRKILQAPRAATS
jgi:methylated-DNA-[protein]-cysteine S-methyltransferase